MTEWIIIGKCDKSVPYITLMLSAYISDYQCLELIFFDFLLQFLLSFLAEDGTELANIQKVKVLRNERRQGLHWLCV